MIFDNWDKHNCNISHTLLWEFNMDKFNWQEMRYIVVERVIERGRMNDFYAAIKLYGGLENFKEIIKKDVKYLSDKDMCFVCGVFNLKKEELRCYIRKQLREKHLNS